jgi:hypothetical protein
MPSRVKFDWNGDTIVQRVAEAARMAIDETLDEADADASSSHWWRNRTGNLEVNIVTERARRFGYHIRGRFGTTYSGVKGHRSGFYGLFLEYRTPFLRPAADRAFPTLAAKIRRRLT